MADIADRAADHMEREAPYLMAASKRASGPVANGRCHYCGEDVEDTLRWCDTDCRDGYDRLSARTRQRVEA